MNYLGGTVLLPLGRSTISVILQQYHCLSLIFVTRMVAAMDTTAHYKCIACVTGSAHCGRFSRGLSWLLCHKQFSEDWDSELCRGKSCRNFVAVSSVGGLFLCAAKISSCKEQPQVLLFSDRLLKGKMWLVNNWASDWHWIPSALISGSCWW